MKRPALSLLVLSAAVLCGSPGAWAVDGAAKGCLADPDGRLDGVPDCIRVGRHVRVESSVSRGTATLNDSGMLPAGMRQDGMRHDGSGGRVRVPTGPVGSLWSGFFTR